MTICLIRPKGVVIHRFDFINNLHAHTILCTLYNRYFISNSCLTYNIFPVCKWLQYINHVMVTFTSDTRSLKAYFRSRHNHVFKCYMCCGHSRRTNFSLKCNMYTGMWRHLPPNFGSIYSVLSFTKESKHV